MKVIRATVTLELEDILGGFPGSIDAMTAFMQNPVMAKRVPDQAREEFIAQDREFFREDDIPKDVLRTGFRMQDGIPMLGAFQIKAMLQQAAQQLYDKDSRPSIYSVARAIRFGLEIRPSLIPITGGSKGDDIELAQIIAHPRTPNIKVPSLRQRARWVGGALHFHVLLASVGAAGKLWTRDKDKDILRDLLDTGALFIGLGTDRGYSHGRFEVSQCDYDDALVDYQVVNSARKSLGHKKAN